MIGKINLWMTWSLNYRKNIEKGKCVRKTGQRKLHGNDRLDQNWQ